MDANPIAQEESKNSLVENSQPPTISTALQRGRFQVNYNNLKGFQKIFATDTARMIFCEHLEPFEFAKLSRLNKVTYHLAKKDLVSMKYLNLWKTNPVENWTHFHALMWLQKEITKALKAPWKIEPCPYVQKWLATTPVLNWHLLKFCERSARVVTLWEEYSTGIDYWLIGQVNEQGKPHGLARMIQREGLWIKEGQFQDGRQAGIGRAVWDTEFYIGEFKNGRAHGQGTKTTDFGTFEGVFNHDSPIQGKWKSLSGKVYEGDFPNGRFNGVYYRDLP